MEKIRVQICTGTTCFVMGGADLLLLEEVVTEVWDKYGVTSEEFNQKVELMGLACSDACREPDKKPPFALINDTLISGATIQILLEHLEPLFFSEEEKTERGI